MSKASRSACFRFLGCAILWLSILCCERAEKVPSTSCSNRYITRAPKQSNCDSNVLFSLRSSAAPLQRLYHADGHGEHRPACYNDLPQPEGPWENNYRKKQTKYNSFLGGAIVAFVGTIVYVSRQRNHAPASKLITIRLIADQRLRRHLLQRLPSRYLRISGSPFSSYLWFRRPASGVLPSSACIDGVIAEILYGVSC